MRQVAWYERKKGVDTLRIRIVDDLTRIFAEMFSSCIDRGDIWSNQEKHENNGA